MPGEASTFLPPSVLSSLHLLQKGNHILPCPFSGVYWELLFFSYDPLDRRAHQRTGLCALLAHHTRRKTHLFFMNWRRERTLSNSVSSRERLFPCFGSDSFLLNTPHAGEGEFLINPSFQTTDHTETTGGKNGTPLAKAILHHQHQIPQKSIFFLFSSAFIIRK